MVSNAWIALLAYEPRIRHAADRRRERQEARRLSSVRSRVLADLRYAVALDIEGFLAANDHEPESTLTCRNASSPQGFVVSRADDSIGTRSLAVDLEAGTLSCRYNLRAPAVDAASDQRVLAIEIGTDCSALSLWNGGLDRTFETVDALSAFLLAPILGV